jgi:c-di-GMP-related signal transduction protein
MMLGYSALGRWLADQLLSAAADPNLRPVRAQMVMRARLTEHLLNAGAEDSLRREVYLCGLFAELDQLLHEPLGVLLNRLPLSERIYAATVKRSGPYAPALQLARALEGDDTKTLRAVCRTHGMGVEEVNRQLLRTLVAVL